MIISEKHRYLFVELPHTGSKAVSAELREWYAGRSIHTKHARYSEFLRTASPEQRTFFVFSAVRNPLDVAVSLYFRYKNDHLGRYSTRRKTVGEGALRTFEWVQRTGADFPSFLRHEYRRPFAYDNFSSEAHDGFDYVMRFENLQDDFASVLGKIGVEPIRALPLVNRTAGKRDHFASYYTPEVIPHAMWVFGPFMERWGYAPPQEWGKVRVPLTARAAFHIGRPARRIRNVWRTGP